MGRSGEILIAALIVIAFALLFGAWREAYIGQADLGAVLCGSGCFMLMLVTYFEVYSHRG